MSTENLPPPPAYVDDRKNEKKHDLFVASYAEDSTQDHQTLDLYDGAIDPVYQAKARILNHAIQEIGMGKYQASLPLSNNILKADYLSVPA